LIYADPVPVGLVVGPLERAEEAAGSGDGEGDEPQFAKQLLPALEADATCLGEVSEDGGQFRMAVGRQLQGLAHGVEDPAEHELSGVPAAVAREELLQGDRLVALLVGDGCREDAVDAVE
jgi:hypothetical protein